MGNSRIGLTFVRSQDHQIQGHPEHPDRFSHFDLLQSLPFAERFLELPAKPAEQEMLVRIHPQSYLDALKHAAQSGPGFVDYGDTYVTRASYDAARMSAGGVIQLLEAIFDGRVSSGFALVRPPGHHTTQNRAMGFCLLNNIAIAARHAQSLGMKKILIVDFDVHHGNGTQAIFEGDPSVFYFSTHQAGIFPGTGYLDERGTGEGEGTIVNIPLPARAGDQALLSIFKRILAPLAQRFQPDIIMVSAGFDAHWKDPLANLILTKDGYYYLSEMLTSIADSLCRSRLLFVLEGGYDPKILQESVAMVLSALAHAPIPSAQQDKAPYQETSISDLIDRAISIHLK